jgi:predicted dehydrogenase
VNRLIRIGVVGVGNIGQHHARIWATMPGCHLVGLADSNAERARGVAARHDVPAYTDYHQLLDQVEAVSLAAPTSLHHEIALDCLAHGVHVLVEKPLAATLDEARKLVQAARQAGLVLQVGHIERFNPTFAELVNVLRGRQILALDSRRISSAIAQAADVSVVYDLMVHDLDLILTLVNARPIIVHAVGDRTRSNQLDHVMALLAFEGGYMASLSASKIAQHKIRQLSVTCAESYVVADLLARTVMIHRQSTADFVTQQGEVLYRQEELIEQVYVPPVEPLHAELQHFLTCVRDGHEPRVSGEDALRVMALAETIESQALAGLKARI